MSGEASNQGHDAAAIVGDSADRTAAAWLCEALRESRDLDALRGAGTTAVPYAGFFADVAAPLLTADDLRVLEERMEASRARDGRNEILFRLRTPSIPVTPKDGGSGVRILGIAGTDPVRFALRSAALDRAVEREHRQILIERGPFAVAGSRPGSILWLPRGAIPLEILEAWTRASLSAARLEPVHTTEDGSAPRHEAIFEAVPRGESHLPLRVFELFRERRSESRLRAVDLRSASPITAARLTFWATSDDASGECFRLLSLASHLHAALGLEVAITLPRESGALSDLASSALEKLNFRTLARDSGADAIHILLRNVYGEFEHRAGAIELAPPDRNLTCHTRSRDRATRRVVELRAMLPASIEGLFAALLEETQGALPPWLAPEQVRVIGLSRAVCDATLRVARNLREAGIRANADVRPTKLLTKEREAARIRVPFVVRIGPREEANGSVSLPGAEEGGDEDAREELLDAFIARVLTASTPPPLRVETAQR